MVLNAILGNKDLFPTRHSLLVFVLYIGLFISQGLLVTASRKGHTTYPYNTTTVVLLTEVLKLICSALIYLREHKLQNFINEVYNNSSMMLLYMVPAFLYCIYNNLSFTNLAAFDPTSYYIFMQIRLLLTGVVFQIIFKKTLSKKQWFSLLLVTLGCVIQKMDNTAIAKLMGPMDMSVQKVFLNSLSFLLILAQMSCSVCAGVYNEYLIKSDSGKNVHLMVQNVYMCLDSIFSNLMVLTYNGQLVTAFSPPSLASIAQTLVILIIVNNAGAGITTSLFLKNLNSILKSFASAIEISFTAILSYLLLDIPIHFNTAIAVIIISYAIVVYAKNPVKNPQVGSTKTDGEDQSLKEKLLEKGQTV